MKSSLKIGSVMGIPIKLHITFLLVLPMFAYVFAINPQPFGFAGVEPPLIRYALSALAAILLFASVLLHELAHSYLAKRYGVNIESITLFLLEEYLLWKKCPENLDKKQRWLLQFINQPHYRCIFLFHIPISNLP